MKHCGQRLVKVDAAVFFLQPKFLFIILIITNFPFDPFIMTKTCLICGFLSARIPIKKDGQRNSLISILVFTA